MELAIDLQHALRSGDPLASDPEHILLQETAQAFEDVQSLLHRVNRRAAKIDALRTKVASDQDELIAAQSRRIVTLEDQLLKLQTVGDDQAAALDQALALVTELESRMTYLERINTKLQALTQPHPLREIPGKRAPDEAAICRDLDLVRAKGPGDDLTRYNEFVRAHTV